VLLPDGRRVGCLEVGKADGFPIFHFHGNGSSRLEVMMVADLAASAGVRLIGLDRPGVGASDPAPARDHSITTYSSSMPWTRKSICPRPPRAMS